MFVSIVIPMFNEENNILKLLSEIEIALKTEASLVVAPLQDLLSLDDKARFNTPGTVGNNWNWRLNSFDSKFSRVYQPI